MEFFQQNPQINWGKNLSRSLEGLAGHKIGEVMKAKQQQEARQEESRISGLLQKGGFSPEESGILAATPANQRNELLLALSQGRNQGGGMQHEQQFQPGGSPQELIQNLLGQQLQKGQGVSPYAPGFEGKKQQEYGGREQDQTALLKQLQEAIGQQQKPQVKPSFAQNIGQGSVKKTAQASNPGSQKFLEHARERWEAADELEQYLDKALDYLKKGKIKGGGLTQRALGSNNVTSSVLNKDKQDYLATLNKIVTLSAQVGRGLPSQARLRLEDAAKVNLGTKDEAAIKILTTARKSGERAKKPYEVANNLIKQNNYMSPDALETRVFEQLDDGYEPDLIGMASKSAGSQAENPLKNMDQRAPTGSLSGISAKDLEGLPDGTKIFDDGKVVGVVRNGQLGKA